MQTKLRTTLLIFATSLLSPFLISAVSHAKARTAKETHTVGIASWYGQQHQGRKMANGQRFDRRKMTAASWYVPLGTVLRVVNLENGKSVMVTVTDRGPDLRLHRIVDLSEAAARKLDYLEKGLTRVYVTPILSYQPQHAELQLDIVEPSQPQRLATETAAELAPVVLASARRSTPRVLRPGPFPKCVEHLAPPRFCVQAGFRILNHVTGVVT